MSHTASNPTLTARAAACRKLVGIFERAFILSDMKHDFPITPALVELIAELIKKPTVQSVAFPHDDERIWRMLVDEQIRRASASGLHPQHAFGLCGPDTGLPFDPADWGGWVYTPYEGICAADLFVKPSWRGFIPSRGMGEDGTLTAANVNKACHHLLVAGHRPEMDCASRHLGDGWTLYTSTKPYSPSNPFSEFQFRPDERPPRTTLLSGFEDD